MIKKIEMQTLICDRCNKDFCEGSDYSAWGLESPIEDMARDEDWYCEDGKHYCPDCIDYDENDELIIKP